MAGRTNGGELRPRPARPCARPAGSPSKPATSPLSGMLLGLQPIHQLSATSPIGSTLHSVRVGSVSGSRKRQKIVPER